MISRVWVSRVWALVTKDLQQHAAVIGLVLLFLPIAWVFFLLAALGAPTTVSYAEIHVSFLRVVFIPFAFAVGNRLVVTELYGRTQLFLEALPMGRAEPFVVKWLLGVGLLLGVALTSLLLALAVAWFREPIDAGFVGSLLSRTVVFTLTLWAFLYTMGQLGKLRIPLYLGLGLVLVILASTTELELMRFGPFALVGPDLATSRAGVPWAEVLTALALAAAFVAVGAALAFVREGSVQEVLSKPMSSRERAMVGIATCAVLIVWSGLQPEPQPEPYRMSGEGVLRAQAVPLVIAHGGESGRADAQSLLTRLEPSLLALSSTMGWAALPECRVVLRGSLDGRTFETAELRPGDGALVRANFRASATPDLEGLEAALVRALIDDRTNRRARFEPQGWARAGFPLWWARCGPHREGGPSCALGPERRASAQLALHGRGVDRPRIAAWDTLREQEGERVSESLAATGMVTLARLGGPEAPSAFARSLFSSWATDDSRVVLATVLSPPRARLREAASVDEETLHREWGADLARDRESADVRTLLGRVSPRPSATLAITEGAASQRILALDVRVPWARTDGVVVSVLTKTLPPFDTLIEPWDLRRDQFVLREGEPARLIELSGRVSRGDRVLVIVDVEDPRSGIGAPTRVLAERREVP